MINLDRIKLPSNGLLGTPAETPVRALKGYELGLLLASLSDEAVNEVIRKVTSNTVKPELLCDEDKQLILHTARRLTFGDTIVQHLRCVNPMCGKIHAHEISYTDFEIIELQEGIHLGTLKLSNGDIVTRRVPITKDYELIEEYKKDYEITNAHYYPMSMSAYIKGIYIESQDREIRLVSEVVNYLMDLPGKDFLKIRDFIEVKFGLDTTFEVECPECKTVFTGGIGINADLFRDHTTSSKE